MGSTVWSVLFKLMDTETLDDCIEDSLFSSSVFCQMFLSDHAYECKLSTQYFDCVSSSGQETYALLPFRENLPVPTL